MSSAVPIYFELSWSILSSIGLLNVFAGFLVVAITNLSLLSAVPIVISAACAIANGLCYYAFYADYPIPSQVAAGVFADLFWLVSGTFGRALPCPILTSKIDTRGWPFLLQLSDLDPVPAQHAADRFPGRLLVSNGRPSRYPNSHHGQQSLGHHEPNRRPSRTG